jgi:hypothetical protein
VKPFKETLRVTNPVRQSRASSRKRVLRGGGRPPLRSVGHGGQCIKTRVANLGRSRTNIGDFLETDRRGVADSDGQAFVLAETGAPDQAALQVAMHIMNERWIESGFQIIDLPDMGRAGLANLRQGAAQDHSERCWTNLADKGVSLLKPFARGLRLTGGAAVKQQRVPRGPAGAFEAVELPPQKPGPRFVGRQRGSWSCRDDELFQALITIPRKYHVRRETFPADLPHLFRLPGNGLSHDRRVLVAGKC